MNIKWRSFANSGFAFQKTIKNDQNKRLDERTQWVRYNDYKCDVLSCHPNHYLFRDGQIYINYSQYGSAVFEWALKYVDTLIFIECPGIEYLFLSVLPGQNLVLAIGRKVGTKTFVADVCNLRNGKHVRFDNFDVGCFDCFVSIGFLNINTAFIRKNLTQIEWDISKVY